MELTVLVLEKQTLEMLKQVYQYISSYLWNSCLFQQKSGRGLCLLKNKGGLDVYETFRYLHKHLHLLGLATIFIIATKKSAVL